MPNYQLGKIYKIVNSINDWIYVGSTTQPLSVRMGAHRANARKGLSCGQLYPAMRDLGIENFRIILIRDHACFSKSQLEAAEYKVLADHRFDLGVKTYNLITADGKAESTREKMRNIIVSDDTRKRMSENNFNRGKFGKDSVKFKRGYLAYVTSQTQQPFYIFSWQEEGQRRSKAFSVAKYGSLAKWFIEVEQEVRYPASRIPMPSMY